VLRRGRCTPYMCIAEQGLFAAQGCSYQEPWWQVGHYKICLYHYRALLPESHRTVAQPS